LIASIVVAAAGPATAHAQLTGAARWADSARVEIEAAFLTGDTVRLRAASVLVERALVAHPGDALLQHYEGYALYREATLRQGRWQQDVGELLERAQAALERAAATQEIPETLALLASVLGQRIGANPIRGMTLGPRSDELMERAAEIGPDNPRVWLLRGMGAIFTPRLFGGGLERARAHLERSARLFEAPTPAPPLPAWGRGEVWTWLGQVHAREGRVVEARAAYARALELEPANDWVRNVLVPALEAR
jgi:tetratricopeptide (TPR) repeat protein